jgi:hypothetical protein
MPKKKKNEITDHKEHSPQKITMMIMSLHHYTMDHG